MNDIRIFEVQIIECLHLFKAKVSLICHPINRANILPYRVQTPRNALTRVLWDEWKTQFGLRTKVKCHHCKWTILRFFHA